MVGSHYERNILHGITASFTKRKIQKYQRKLGNGHDVELHLTVAELYRHLNEDSLALESYHLAINGLLKKGMPLKTADSDTLINIYKRILAIIPFSEDICNKLGHEYHRRGLDYRAIELYTSLAERFARNGDYRKATEQYQRIFAMEPNSISARVTCANLYCQLGDHKQGAREYAHIGDIYFEHQKFDGALEYYRQAQTLYPDNDTVKQKLQITQQILDGVLIPRAQASLQKLHLMSQDSNALKRTLEEKEQIEQELRTNIQQLKYRYQQSVTTKNEQLRLTQKRLNKLSTYVAKLKDNLEAIASEKQRLQKQLEQEIAYKCDLEHKLIKLGTLHVNDCETRSTEDSSFDSGQQAEHAKRLESAIIRLNQERTKLKGRLQEKLTKSSNRETRLREHLKQQIHQGTTLEQQLIQRSQERKHIEQALQHQLQKSQKRENFLREQMKQLIEQHECALKQVEHEQHMLEEKYRATQARINSVEKDNMDTLEQLQGELLRQCKMESHFSENFHNSLQEIVILLHNQEQEIQKLEQLQS